jgi:polyisoprenoid-binding protein YceI
MRQFLAITGILALGAVTIAAGDRAAATPEATLWNVDVAHTGIDFSVRHFFTPVRGTFDDYEVELLFDPEDPKNSSVEVQISVASVNTGNEKRDNHLRSGDWFEAEKYPYLTFKSTSVRQISVDRFIATGELTIKDTTKEIELPITLLGITDLPSQMSEMMGGVKHVASFETAYKLDRRDYDVGVGSWAETIIVSSDVEIAITLEANKK